MALINRVSRLFKADFHAVLDRIEEPDVLLRQAIREMQDELAMDEQHMKRLTQERQQLHQQETDIIEALDNIEAELDVCLDADKPDLARTLVRRQLENQQTIKHILNRRQAAQQASESLSKRIDENHQQLKNFQQKAELLLEQEASGEDYSGFSFNNVVIRDEEVEIALLKVMQQRKQVVTS